MIDFSFIVPTRNRPAQLLRFLTSIKEMTRELARVEVMLGIDEDDVVSGGVDVPGLQIRRVSLPPGQTMAWMNTVLTDSASGRYIMLLNDDIVLRTPGWDEILLSHLRQYEDEIVLIHVNDLLFFDGLCCFPLVTRTYCDLVGLCGTNYQRYRIDDNIFDIFCMLAFLGERRIVYLPDVVFEHENYIQAQSGQRLYTLNREIFQEDMNLYERRLPQRKRDATTLYNYILQFRNRHQQERCRQRLELIGESFFLRRPEFLTIQREAASQLKRERARTTIGLVTSDSQGPRAYQCIEAIKQHTSHYELVVLDHTNPHGLDLAAEYQRLLQMSSSPYAVLMTDEVQVTRGWLDACLEALTDGVALSMPVHLDRAGRLHSAGLYVSIDGTDCASRLLLPDGPTPIPAPDGALMVLDRAKCARVQLNDVFKRYFFDVDLGLQLWEQGLQVVCTPRARVTRLEGPQALAKSLQELLLQHDGLLFVGEWVESKRLEQIWKERWQRIPEIALPLEAIHQVEQLLDARTGEPLSGYEARVGTTLLQLNALPSFRQRFQKALMVYLQAHGRGIPAGHRSTLMQLSESFHTLVLVEPGHQGHHLFMLDGLYMAFPESAGMPDEALLRQGKLAPVALSAQLRLLKDSLAG